MTRLVRGSLLAVAFVVAACGGSSSSPSPAESPAGTGTPTGSPTSASRTVAPTRTPSPAPTQTGGAGAVDWPVYHGDNTHTGQASSFPAFTGTIGKSWAVKLDGAVYAEPLVVHGQVIAVTERDSFYALNAQTGAIVWTRKVGNPVSLSTLPCGNINPLGITGTPAYDATTNTLFAVAEVTGPKHVLFALDADTGTVRWSRNVDLSGDQPATHQQRTALVVANGYVYFGFGGLAGDCGQYRGELIGVPVTGQGATIAYKVPVKREGAVWATAGPAVDSTGNLYVSTGNGSSTSSFDGSDSVVELSSSLQMISRFAPKTWASDNARDLDLGSLGPVLLPGGWVFIAGKSGTGYVLKQGSLGGIGGQVSQASVCSGGAFGGAATSGNTVFVPCRSLLREVTIGADGSIHPGWQSTAAGYSPVIGGGVLWSVNANGSLVAIDPATGHARASIKIGSVPHFATPTLWNGMIFNGTLSGVFASHV